MAYKRYNNGPRTAPKPAPSNVRCPDCKGRMVIRTSRFKGEDFFGCTNYPKCRGTRSGKYTPVDAAALANVPFTPTPEQLAIWDEMANGDRHIVSNSFAGTGKSTTTRIGMAKIDPGVSIFYGCFGSKNVAEFVEKGYPENATVLTLNSFGNRMVNRWKKVKLVDDKVENIFDSLYPRPDKEADGDRNLRLNVRSGVRRLVALCKGYLFDPNDRAGLVELAERHDVDFDSETAEQKALEMVPQVLAINNEMEGVIDFDDQIYFCVIKNLPVQQFGFVIIDEAQDMNPMQHALVMRMLAERSRCMIIGDDYQAIFGFRGSDTDSMANFKAGLANTGRNVAELPLTVTQRCPKSIVKYAQQYVTDIKHRDDAADGEIFDLEADQSYPLYQPGDFVLCRVNAPLTGIAYRLIKQGTKAVVLGRDIAEGLLALIDRLKAESINELMLKLDEWQSRECDKVKGTRREEVVVTRVVDQADCIRVLADGCNAVADITAAIKRIFADERNGQPVGAVTLCSIHKAKGLESRRVFWLYPGITCKSEQDWQQQQERNLKYVASTRTKHTLYRVWEKGKNPKQFPMPPAIATPAEPAKVEQQAAA